MIEDIEYFKKKLETTTNPQLRDKLVKQIELLEDAVTIYRLTRPGNGDEIFDDNLNGGIPHGY